MALKEFRNLVVFPNVEEFRTNFSSLRHAFNAVAAVDALAAHIFVWCQTNAPAEVYGAKNDSEYRNELAKQSSYFRLLRDIAKAQKHVNLVAHRPILTRAEQVTARPIGWGEGGWGEGRWGDGIDQVVVDVIGKNGTMSYFVSTTVDRALSFLESEINRLGI